MHRIDSGSYVDKLVSELNINNIVKIILSAP